VGVETIFKLFSLQNIFIPSIVAAAASFHSQFASSFNFFHSFSFQNKFKVKSKKMAK
jgi:hypothetical protein